MADQIAVRVVETKQVKHTDDERWRGKYTRVYVWPRGETIVQNLLRRHARPVEAYRAAVKAALPPEQTFGMRWSQKAGCSCGCSPAFITRQALGYDIHLTVEAVEAVPEAAAS